MIDRIDSSSSEFHNITIDSHMPKFMEHNDRNEDVKANVQGANEKIPQIVRNRGMERFQYFQSIKNKTVFPQNTLSHRQFDTEALQRVCTNYSERSLKKLPSEILDYPTPPTFLDLSKNKFEYFPLEIIQLHNLKSLTLDHNKIKCIPSEIIKLPMLEYFSIGHNLIQSLPLSLNKLSCLREFNIESNLLDSFSDEITNLPRLKVLKLTHNRLSHFPASFCNLYCLEELHFEWFKYTDPPMQPIQREEEGILNIKKLINKCAEYSSRGMKGLSFLDFIEYFSTNEIDVLKYDFNNRNMLHIASMADDVSVMRYIISYHPELIDMVDKDSLTPLCYALQKDRHNAARYLLKHNSHPGKGGGHHGSALHIAVKRLNTHLVKDILTIGEVPNRIDMDGNTPLHLAMTLMTEGHTKAMNIAQLLLEAGANPNAKNKECWTPLHLACRRRDKKSVSWALSYNVEQREIHGKDGRDDVFKINKRGGGYRWTPLHVATYSGSSDIVDLLVHAGADLFKKSMNGYTPKRVINKHGLTLKLMEKHEKAFIKAQVIGRKIENGDTLQNNLRTLNRARSINNASKNKFGDQPNYDPPIESTGFFYYYKNKQRFAPLLGSGPVSKRQDDDSFEVSPETDDEEAIPMKEIIDKTKIGTQSEEDLFPDEKSMNERPLTERQKTERPLSEKYGTNDTTLDFCKEINEDVMIEASQFSRGIPFKEKKNIIGNARAVPVTSESFKGKKPKATVMFLQPFENGIENYSTELQLKKLDPTFFKNEIKRLKECILADKVLYSEKLKIFIALKILNRAIIDYIYKNYPIPVDKESFPYFALRENIHKQNSGTPRILNDILPAFALYELVPQGVMGFYLSLASNSFENVFIKQKICTFLTDIRYFPAVDFFETIIHNDIEEKVVRSEADKCYDFLKGMLNPGTMKNYFKAANKAAKEKLYGVPPSTKTNLNQMRMLDKYESLVEVTRTDDLGNNFQKTSNNQVV